MKMASYEIQIEYHKLEKKMHAFAVKSILIGKYYLLNNLKKKNVQ